MFIYYIRKINIIFFSKREGRYQLDGNVSKNVSIELNFFIFPAKKAENKMFSALFLMPMIREYIQPLLLHCHQPLLSERISIAMFEGMRHGRITMANRRQPFLIIVHDAITCLIITLIYYMQARIFLTAVSLNLVLLHCIMHQ